MVFRVLFRNYCENPWRKDSPKGLSSLWGYAQQWSVWRRPGVPQHWLDTSKGNGKTTVPPLSRGSDKSLTLGFHLVPITVSLSCSSVSSKFLQNDEGIFLCHGEGEIHLKRLTSYTHTSNQGFSVIFSLLQLGTEPLVLQFIDGCRAVKNWH